MICQLLRNKIAENKTLIYNLNSIESIILKNITIREDDIIKEVVNQWKNFSPINLTDAVINGINYKCWIEFDHYLTHAKLIDIYLKNIEEKSTFSSEYGDLALLVAYFFENELLIKKISVLQSKKEISTNRVRIDLHQLYFMHFWPVVEFSGKHFSFPGISADTFSFYHFILTHSYNPQRISTVCSAPYVKLSLGLSRNQIETRLKNWLIRRKTVPNTSPPSNTLSINLGPITTARSEWRLIPKPYARFLKESAYLFFGTDNPTVFELSRERIPNILVFKVAAAREKSYLVDNIRLI